MRISSVRRSHPRTIHFKSSDYEKTDTDEFYVLDAQPRSKNKFLFRGHIWVNAKDFAITRVEGEPAVNPSWWTVKTDFKRRYQKIGRLLVAGIQRERNEGAHFRHCSSNHQIWRLPNHTSSWSQPGFVFGEALGWTVAGEALEED